MQLGYLSVKDSSPNHTPGLTFFNMLVSRWTYENPEDFWKCSICRASSVWERNGERCKNWRTSTVRRVTLRLKIHLKHRWKTLLWKKGVWSGQFEAFYLHCQEFFLEIIYSWGFFYEHNLNVAKHKLSRNVEKILGKSYFSTCFMNSLFFVIPWCI